MPKMNQIGSVYIASSATVLGDVTLGEGCNVWYNCVIRGDVAPIRVGARVNIQDGALLHCEHDVPLDVAEDVSIGHYAIVHCRRVGRGTLIGTRATVLDKVEIGQDCLIAAGTLIPPGKVIPDGSVVMGMPGRIVRQVTDHDREYLRFVTQAYFELAPRHAAGEFLPFPTSLNGKIS